MGSQSNGLDWVTEPIAIIGMSCKFGGDATNAEKLWDMVSKGESAWSEIPSSRFNWKGSYHPESERRGTVCESNQTIILFLAKTFRILFSDQL
jgi:acyl transferase domain-containing protein